VLNELGREINVCDIKVFAINKFFEVVTHEPLHFCMSHLRLTIDAFPCLGCARHYFPPQPSDMDEREFMFSSLTVRDSITGLESAPHTAAS
jgi:hypothetical protein